MFKVKLCCFCDSAIVDQRSNVVSLISIMESVIAPSLPILLPKITVFFLLEKEDADPEIFKASLKFFLNNVEVQSFDVQASFQSKKRSRLIVEVGGFLVDRPGVLEARLLSREGEQIGSCAIDVKMNAPPQIEASSS